MQNIKRSELLDKIAAGWSVRCKGRNTVRFNLAGSEKTGSITIDDLINGEWEGEPPRQHDMVIKLNLDKCTVGGEKDLVEWIHKSRFIKMEKTMTTVHGYAEFSDFFEREDGAYKIDWVYDPCGNDNKGEKTLIDGPTKIQRGNI